MKSICISIPTKVGMKKVTYEVEDDVYEYAIKVLEGEEPIPTYTVTEVADVEPAPETY